MLIFRRFALLLPAPCAIRLPAPGPVNEEMEMKVSR